MLKKLRLLLKPREYRLDVEKNIVIYYKVMDGKEYIVQVDYLFKENENGL